MAFQLFSMALLVRATGWCYQQDSCWITGTLSGGRQWGKGGWQDWHHWLILGSGCILTQHLDYSAVRESVSNHCHLPPANPPGYFHSRCLFTSRCEGLVTYSHYGDCSMWLVSQEGSQPQQDLMVKKEVGEVSTHVYLIGPYRLITSNFQSPVSVALQESLEGPGTI